MIRLALPATCAVAIPAIAQDAAPADDGAAGSDAERLPHSFRVVEETFRFISQWSDGPDAYRLYAPGAGSAGQNYVLCRLVPGSVQGGFHPSAECLSVP